MQWIHQDIRETQTVDLSHKTISNCEVWNCQINVNEIHNNVNEYITNLLTKYNSKLKV